VSFGNKELERRKRKREKKRKIVVLPTCLANFEVWQAFPSFVLIAGA
jgi:hypothetical protein